MMDNTHNNTDATSKTRAPHRRRPLLINTMAMQAAPRRLFHAVVFDLGGVVFESPVATLRQLEMVRAQIVVVAAFRMMCKKEAQEHALTVSEDLDEQ